MTEMRPAIIKLHEKGKSVREIEELLDVPKLALSHRANETQEMLAEECPEFISRDAWPPNSPDLNPLDYSIWSILEQKA